MSAVQCFKKPSCKICEKFSGRRLLKFLKVAKPILKLMKARRTGMVTPSVCNYDVVEAYQNDLNESDLFQLDFKFFEGNEVDENLKNEELEKRLLEKLGSGTDDDATPQSFPTGSWSVLSDVDIYKREDDYVSSRQTAEQQVPVAVN